jgi:hypothetical protein
MLIIPRLFAAALLVFGFVSAAAAGVETVEIQKVQVVRSLSGIVTDPNGSPITGAVVAELGADGTMVLRTVKTDTAGHFNLSQRPNQRTYSLRISMNGFDPLIVHLRTSRWTKHVLKVHLVVAA